MRKSIIVIALLAILAHSVPAQTKDFTFSIQINPAHPIVEIMLLGGGWGAFIFLGGLNIEMGPVDRMSMRLDTAVSTVTLDSFYNGFIFSFTPQFIFYPQRNRMRGWYIDCVSQQSQPQWHISPAKNIDDARFPYVYAGFRFCAGCFDGLFVLRARQDN